MRYPEGHKDAVHARVVQAAAAALRAEGLSGVSIPALMKRAGLTHGGFYAHFENRDALVKEAVLAAAAGSAESIFAESTSLAEALSRYLSPQHLAHPEQGCVVAALGMEGARQGRPVRRAFAEAAVGLCRLVERKLRPRSTAAVPSDDALRLASTMVGAVVLARLVDDPALAARILAAARRVESH